MTFTFEDMKEKIKHGINYGNALECFDDHRNIPGFHTIEHDAVDENGLNHSFKVILTHYDNPDSSEPAIKTCWSVEEIWDNPETTDEIINFYKQLGYTAIRLPVNVSWHHLDNSTEIDPKWFEYIRSVVDKIINAGMFCCVVLFGEAYNSKFYVNNIDNYKNPFKNSNVKRIVDHWRGLADILKDIPEDKLTFELLNEFSLGPYAEIVGDIEFGEASKITAEIYSILIDMIRQSGGHNADRLIGIGGYRGDADITLNNIDTFKNLMEDARNYFSFAMYLDPEFTFCYFTDTGMLRQELLDGIPYTAYKGTYEFYINHNYRIVISEYGTSFLKCATTLNSQDDIDRYKNACLKHTAFESIIQEKLGIPSYIWDDGLLINRSELKVMSDTYYDISMSNIPDKDLLESFI